MLIFNANNVNLFVSLLCYLNTLYIQIFKMAAMLQQQYVAQETEPRDWAACEEMGTFCSEHEFVAWFDMLERGAGEMCVFGQAVATLVNKINCGNTTTAQSCV